MQDEVNLDSLSFKKHFCLNKNPHKTLRRRDPHLTLILSLTSWRLQMLRGQNESDDCSCLPTSAVAFCGCASKCCSSSPGPVSSKFTSRLNLARLVSRNLKMDCSEISTYIQCIYIHRRLSYLNFSDRGIHVNICVIWKC